MATGLNLNKQATSASSGASHTRVQVDANGVLQQITSAGVAHPVGQYYIWVELDDLSTASSCWAAVPAIGEIVTLKTILHTAITVADAAITAEINTVAVTGLAITVTQSGSAVGDVDTATATAAKTLAIGDSLEMITDGGSSTAARVTGVFTVAQY